MQQPLFETAALFLSPELFIFALPKACKPPTKYI